jgi:hypothetical protein
MQEIFTRNYKDLMIFFGFGIQQSHIDFLSQFQIETVANTTPDKDKNIGNLLQEIGGLVNQYNNSKTMGLWGGNEDYIKAINKKIEVIKDKIDPVKDTNKDLKDSIDKEFRNFNAKIKGSGLDRIDPRDNLTYFNNLKFNIYDKLGKELEKIQARTADEQLLEIFESKDEIKKYGDLTVAVDSVYGVLEKTMNYLKNIDEAKFKETSFSQDIIKLTKNISNKKIFNFKILTNKGEAINVSKKLENFLEGLGKKTAHSKKEDFLKSLEKILEPILEEVKSKDIVNKPSNNIKPNRHYNINTKGISVYDIAKSQNNKNLLHQFIICEDGEILGELVIPKVESEDFIDSFKNNIMYFNEEEGKEKIFFVNNNNCRYISEKQSHIIFSRKGEYIVDGAKIIFEEGKITQKDEAASHKLFIFFKGRILCNNKIYQPNPLTENVNYYER